MKITLHVRDENGWPVMTVDPPAFEKGDRGLRLVNFAQDRVRELETVCAKQRELTKEARRTGVIRGCPTFLKLWREALTE